MNSRLGHMHSCTEPLWSSAGQACLLRMVGRGVKAWSGCPDQETCGLAAEEMVRLAWATCQPQPARECSSLRAGGSGCVQVTTAVHGWGSNADDLPLLSWYGWA